MQTIYKHTRTHTDTRYTIYGIRYTIFIFAFRLIRCTDAFNCSSCMKNLQFHFITESGVDSVDALDPHSWHVYAGGGGDWVSSLYADAINNFLAK